MTDLLVDTDVLIDHLRGAVELRRPESRGLFFSVVTRGELLAGPARQEPAVRRLLGSMRELPVTPDIADSVGLIRRETKVPLPDALIAATAIANGLELMTRNRREFERIAGLVLRAYAGISVWSIR